MDILVVGELNVDLIMDQIKGTPAVGKEQIAEEMTLTLGSSSAIFASNSSSLGSRVAFSGWIGHDHFGHLVVESLDEAGVDCRYVRRTDHRTGITVAFNINQERMMVTHPGAMNHMSVEDQPLDDLAQFKHLHASAVFLQPALKPGLVNLFKRAQEAGLSTSLDTQWDPDEMWDLDLELLLPFVTWFMPNETEICHMTRTSSVNDAISALPEERGDVVVKLGTNGSLLVRPDGSQVREEAIRMDRFGDAIGAGDSFDAGFIRAKLLGWPDKRALRLGNLSGAVSTTKSGGTAAIESLEQLMETATSKGYRLE